MILSNLTIKEFEFYSEISYDLLWKSGKKDILWFRVDKEYTSSLSKQYDAGVTALIIAAMRMGESIQINGSVSPELIKNLIKFQHVFIKYYPNLLSVVTISSSSYSDCSEERNTLSCLAFSGGIDSFYSLIKLRSRLTYALIIHGFDIPLEERVGFDHLKKEYGSSLATMNITPIAVSTNLKTIINPLVDWTITHSCATLSVAMIFKNMFGKIFFSSGYSNYNPSDDGSHPESDPLLSNGIIEVEHYGDNISRPIKTEIVSEFEPAYSNLHVCSWLSGPTLDNCCRCSKCVRTMIPLSIIGKLEKFSAFSKPLTVPVILRTIHAYPYTYNEMREVFAYAKAKKAIRLVIVIWISLMMNYPILLLLKFFSFFNLKYIISNNKVILYLFRIYIRRPKNSI